MWIVLIEKVIASVRLAESVWIVHPAKWWPKMVSLWDNRVARLRCDIYNADSLVLYSGSFVSINV
jgi:cobalamin biosynthesis protein CobD/CbiB